MVDLSLSDIAKNFGQVCAVDKMSLEISSGEFVVFVGPSGCGKTTTLRMIAGLEEISGGTFSINGVVANEMTPVERSVAMVFQSYALYPNMTVRENLAFGLRQQKTHRHVINQKVTEVAASLRLTDLLDRRPGQLSGGQSQRVAIGRAIARDPQIFLFDEPLSNLDAELRVHMRAEIAALHRNMKRTTVYVTHDQVEAMTLGDKIVVMNGGKIEQVGRPMDLYDAPANKFVAGFIGSPRINFLPNETLVDPNGKMANHLRSLGKSEQLEFGVRPEDIVVCKPSEADVRATVSFVEQMGSESLLHCDIELVGSAHQSRAIAKMGRNKGFSVGEKIGLSFDPVKTHTFDNQGKRISLQ